MSKSPFRFLPEVSNSLKSLSMSLKIPLENMNSASGHKSQQCSTSALRRSHAAHARSSLPRHSWILQAWIIFRRVSAEFCYECCEWWQLLFLNCADSKVFSQDHCCQSWAPCHCFSAICAKHSCHSWPPRWKSSRSSGEPGIHSEVSAYFNIESSFSFRKLQSRFSFSTQDSSNPSVHKIISLPTQLFKDRSWSFHSPTALQSFRSCEWPTPAAANSFQENRTRHQLRHPWGKSPPNFM